MYKFQYTPNEAKEQFKLIDESTRHDGYKNRAKRYIENRIVDTPEGVQQ